MAVKLDVGVVRRLIGEQFPELGGLEVRRFAAGWDHELFSVGPEWILRFPQRAERAPWLVREVEIMRAAGDALGALVPRFELLGEPSAVFPWPFVGYRRVAGVAADGPRRFIHNDICPDHLITSPRTGRLTGLIDFTDATAGEPVLDFVGLIGIGGYEFIGQVMDRYDLGLERRFAGKLEWLARTLTLRWLAEAADGPEDDIGKIRSWVAQAFAS